MLLAAKSFRLIMFGSFHSIEAGAVCTVRTSMVKGPFLLAWVSLTEVNLVEIRGRMKDELALVVVGGFWRRSSFSLKEKKNRAK